MGKEEASGSPWISSLPEKPARAVPSPPEGSKKESCFSAVEPVSGWKTWVKWVAPFSSAQSFIAAATASARLGVERLAAARGVACSFSKTSSGRRSRCTTTEKTLAPKASFSGRVRSSAPRDSPLELHCAAVTFCWRIRVIALVVPRLASRPVGGHGRLPVHSL